MVLLKDENQPVYKQLREMLADEIASGRLNPGDRIYTEGKLADRFQVSRTTIRRALGGLEREGLIVRFPGKGTFINQSGKTPDPQHFSVGINFFVNFFQSNYYGPLVEGVLAEAEKSSILIRIVSPQECEEQIPDDIDGFLFTGALNPDSEIHRRIAKGILPAVGFNSRVNKNISFIGVDNYEESRKGVEFLIRRGHRKIGFFGNRLSSNASRERYRGYEDAMKDAGLKTETRNIHFFDLDADRYSQGVEYLRHADVDAVFVSLAPVFTSLLHAMNKLRISTDDLQLLCFDDLEDYRLDWPGVAYIKMPLQLIGERMVSALRQKLILDDRAPVINEFYKAEIKIKERMA